MILKSSLEHIIDAQKSNLEQKEPGLQRLLLDALPEISSHASIISGIRRCGKSTLLNQLIRKKYPQAFFLNFEDPRLYEFEEKDLIKLDAVIKESTKRVLFFDEIQLIPDWERYIRFKLDEGFLIILTGSNASLLGEDLGTKLTGRHITKELFPFSYLEFCEFKQLDPSETSLATYLKLGGFPEYVKTNLEDILTQLLDDILMRDIAVRYSIRDIKSLQRLALYLISNVGKPLAANRLKTFLEGKARSTILEYLSHLEQSYLFFQVAKFSYSYRKQLINPKKIYAIDTGLVEVNSVSFSKDLGRKFENLIFLHLRRQYKEIYYFKEKGECDFIVCTKGSVKEIIQVCYKLTSDNMEREINGLLLALEYFDFPKGRIITQDQRDTFHRNGKTISVLPAYEYMSSQ